MWGATATARNCHVRYGNFNPRAPCGARRPGAIQAMPGRPDFNPRAPCGARLITTAISSPHQQFQSTRPVWGATWTRLSWSLPSLFQSTRPVWGATRWRRQSRFAPVISIHAPRVGRDASAGRSSPSTTDFNPRAPCGARRWRSFSRRCWTRFQSTRPVWGATRAGHRGRRPRLISIHAPRVGRDRMHKVAFVQQYGISIHAPRVGRDLAAELEVLDIPQFQSTRPVWGATCIR